VEHTEGVDAFPNAPPTIQRWFAPAAIIAKFGPDTRVAMVDADTMIRWDTPDFMDHSENSLVAVRARNQRWASKTVAAFQHFFPSVILSNADYFNAGIVVVGINHLTVLSHLIAFYSANKSELEQIFRASDMGTDQTLLNFIVRQDHTQVSFLPKELNFLNCFDYDPDARKEYEHESGHDWSTFARQAFSKTAFSFIDRAFVWHFTNTIRSRSH
jgi:lipopolysaccharide biosynthesis glycosyltransferase